MHVTPATANAYGIYTNANSGGRVLDNRIGDLVPTGTVVAYGIYNVSSAVRGNIVIGASVAGSIGIR